MSTVNVAATVEAGNVPPRVRLDITSSDATSTTITRLNPDGRMEPVRTSTGGPLQITGSSALLYDYTAPFGRGVQYSSLESPSVTSAMVTVDAASVWLIHPGVPALSLPIELRAGSLQDETYSVQQGTFWPMGRETPVIVTDGSRKGMQSSMTVATETVNDLASLRAILSDASTLFLNIPASFGFLVDSCYIAAGDVKISRRSTIGSMTQRDVEIPFTVVARPAGGSQSQRTFADVLADNSSFGSLMTRYRTMFDLLAGP